LLILPSPDSSTILEKNIKVVPWKKDWFYVFWEILVKISNFGQKSKLWSKIEILVKNLNVGQKSKCWSKI